MMPRSQVFPAGRSVGLFRTGLHVATMHRVVFGALFLVLCGWKFTFGLDGTLDLDVHHETMYIAYMLGYYPGGTPADYSPLYVDLYRLEYWLWPSPIQVFFVQETILTIALPVALFVYLATRAVPVAFALPSALYLMITAAVLQVGPKPMHLALIVMFFALALFVRFSERSAKWGFMLVVCAALSLIRPELLYALPVLGAYCLYLVYRSRGRDRELVAAIVCAMPVIALLFWQIGVPLFGERSADALAWHFAANYVRWNHTHDLPFTADYMTIYHNTFGDAKSLPAAFMANPSAFLHHMLTNLIRSPLAFGVFLAHFNILLPRFLPFTLLEAVIGGAAFVTAIAVYGGRLLRDKRGQAHTGWEFIRRIPTDFPDVICLVVFLVPYVAMIIVIYPRYHYALAVGTIVFAIGAVVLGAGARAPVLGRAAVVLPFLLFALVPSLGSAGARVDLPIGDVSASPRPALAEARFLRGLKTHGAVTVLELTDPGVSPYVGPNFRSTSNLDKPNGLVKFLNANAVSVVIDDDRLREFNRFTQDPEWAAFRRTPGAFGFEAHVLPQADAIIYLKKGLLGPAASTGG